VRRILLSEAQSGRMRVRWDGRESADRWLPATGQEAIVDRATWEAMQSKLAERSGGRGATNKRRHALAGLLRCSACGATLKASVNRPKRKSGGRYEYWHYTCKVYNSGCSDGYTISERRALAELGELVDARLAATETWADPGMVTDDLGAVETRIGSLAEQLAAADEKVRRAHKAYIDAEEDLAEVARDELNTRRARARELRAELDDAQSAYAAAQHRKQPPPDLETLRDLLADWRSFPDNEKRMALEAVIDHAVLGPPGRSRRLAVVWTDGTTARPLDGREASATSPGREEVR
jgi:site-specific DNA recombinase